MSARAACRFEQLGLDGVHDLIGGRAAWTALGFPTEGEVGDRRRISQYVVDTRTVGVDATIGDVVDLGELRFPVPVLGRGDVVLGAVHPTVRALPRDTPVERAMVPAPGTIRPEMRIDEVAEQLRSDGLDHVLVTTVSGVLVGLVITEELHV